MKILATLIASLALTASAIEFGDISPTYQLYSEADPFAIGVSTAAYTASTNLQTRVSALESDITGKVPTSRTVTVNGVVGSLGTNVSFTVSGGIAGPYVRTVNGGSNDVVITAYGLGALTNEQDAAALASLASYAATNRPTRLWAEGSDNFAVVTPTNAILYAITPQYDETQLYLTFTNIKADDNEQWPGWEYPSISVTGGSFWESYLGWGIEGNLYGTGSLTWSMDGTTWSGPTPGVWTSTDGGSGHVTASLALLGATTNAVAVFATLAQLDDYLARVASTSNALAAQSAAKLDRSGGTATNLSVATSFGLLGYPWTWNSDRGTYNVALPNDVVGQLFQEQHAWCRNQTGETIANGKVVCSAGAVGDNTSIRLFSPSDLTCAWGLIGMVTVDAGIGHGADGQVTTHGEVNDLNTSMWAVSNRLWATDNGGVTNVEPVVSSSRLKYYLGVVLRSHASQGRIYFSPQYCPNTADVGAAPTNNPAFTGTLTLNGTNVALAGQCCAATIWQPLTAGNANGVTIGSATNAAVWLGTSPVFASTNQTFSIMLRTFHATTGTVYQLMRQYGQTGSSVAATFAWTSRVAIVSGLTYTTNDVTGNDYEQTLGWGIRKADTGNSSTIYVSAWWKADQ